MAQAYFEKIEEILAEVKRTQIAVICEAGKAVADTVINGGIVHIFGVGHSHILAEEAFFRAGGLAPVNALLEPSFMLHEGALKGAMFEKLHGIAPILLDYYDVKEGDILIIASNSGISTVSVEMALEARRRNVRTIAITSVRYSQAVQGGKTALYELADFVIDNGGIPGDALLELPGLKQRVGPSSTVVGAAILNAIMVEATRQILAQGSVPPLFLSSHLNNAAEHNFQLIQRYRAHIRNL